MALDVAAIEARANAATAGPWDAIGPYEVHVLATCDCQPEGSCGDCEEGGFVVCSFNEQMRERASANFEFIAHARTDVPALIARVRELETENAALRKKPWYMADSKVLLAWASRRAHDAAQTLEQGSLLASHDGPWSECMDLACAKDREESDYDPAKVSSMHVWMGPQRD